MVGTTDTNPANNGGAGNPGIAISPDGVYRAARTGNVSLDINRMGSDGEIAAFRKDGNTVGEIGSEGGDSLYIASGDTGIRFSGGADVIIPATINGAVRDNAIDLGMSSSRWKDLYLSGGVYLGGTGSTNHLDDYEEGTFTPTMSTASSHAVQQGFYTKVGRIVHCQITLQWVNSGTSTGSLGGLPFTVFGQNYATVMSREWYATGETWNANLNIGANGTYGFTYANNQSTLSNGGTYGIGLTFVYRVS